LTALHRKNNRLFSARQIRNLTLRPDLETTKNRREIALGSFLSIQVSDT